MLPEFKAFPKITRLFEQDICVTEKIDGTNGLIAIVRDPYENLVLYVGSRNRWLDTTKEGDNHGFAKWAMANHEELFKLGEGFHYGEWWGQGIQHGYGMDRKVFSLFNTHRWSDDAVRPACCDVVPVLYQGPITPDIIHQLKGRLGVSAAAHKYGVVCHKVEGRMVYLTKAGVYLKSPHELGAKG